MKTQHLRVNSTPFWSKPEKRKPLRTVQEMADEFGVTRSALNAYVLNRNGPRAVFYTQSSASAKQSWVDPKAMRDWWATFERKPDNSLRPKDAAGKP